MIDGVLHPPEIAAPASTLIGVRVEVVPKRIPIAEAKRVAKAQGCEQVIIMAWDGELSHCVTYGTNKSNCAQAAEGGRKLMEVLGWNDG